MKSTTKPHLYRMLSFLIPCCMMMAVFALNGKYPFGGDALLESDAAAQYYPFLLLLRRTVRSGGSLLYTWRAGLGSNFWALIAYYCLNPWNLIAIALPETMVQGFLSLSVCMRIGFAGLCTAILMQTVSGKQDLSIVIFASCYGLSQWFIWNYFQLIWLDAAAMMPLLLAGMYRLVRDGRCKMFIAVLVLSLICNPYFSFITCMMTFFCWICTLIILKKPLRKLHREIGRFFGSAALSGGIAAVILIPLACAVRVTGSAAQTFPDLLDLPYSFPEMLSRLVTMTYPIQHIGLPNLSGTMLGVLLFAGYLTAKRIPLRERLTAAGLLGFLLVSLWYPPLNYIWHGMHVPNGFIHRFAFLVPFVLTMAGWRFTATLSEADACPKSRRLLQLGAMAAVTVGICALAVYYQSTDIILIPLLFTAGYCLLYLWRYCKPQNAAAVSVMLLVTVCAEMFVSVNMLVGFLPELYRAGDLTAKPEQKRAAAAICEAANGLPQRTAFRAGSGFNPELFCDLPFGGTLYSSLIPAELEDTLSYLGMYSGSDLNRYFYHTLAPASVLLTDIRYVIAPKGGDFPAPFYATLGETCAQKFAYDLPFGFCIPAPLKPESGISFPERQNALFRQITGEDTALCRILPAAVSLSDGDYTRDGEQIRLAAQEKSTLTLTVTVDQDGWYLFDMLPDSALCAALRQYFVYCGDKVVTSGQFPKSEPFTPSSEMISAGECRKGQQIRLEMHFSAHSGGSVLAQAAGFDPDAFAAGLERIAAYTPAHLQVQDDEIRCEVTTDAGHPMLYLPVPYEKGWHAEIDGQKTAVTEAMPGMLGLSLTPGTHSVRLRYIPQGFAAGCAVSFGSILLCALLLLCRKFRRQLPKEN